MMCFGIANRNYNVVQCFRKKVTTLEIFKVFHLLCSVSTVYFDVEYLFIPVVLSKLNIFRRSQDFVLAYAVFAKTFFAFPMDLYLSHWSKHTDCLKPFWRSCNCVIDFICKLISIFHWKDRCL